MTVYYLDSTIAVNIGGLTITQSKTYPFYIYDASDTILFAGNTFIQAGKTNVVITINDFVDRRYDLGYVLRTPIVNHVFIDGKVIQQFRVGVDINGSIKKSSLINVYMAYRYPDRKKRMELNYVLTDTGTENLIQGARTGVPELLPRIPLRSTSEFGFGVMLKGDGVNTKTYRSELVGEVYNNDSSLYTKYLSTLNYLTLDTLYEDGGYYHKEDIRYNSCGGGFDETTTGTFIYNGNIYDNRLYVDTVNNSGTESVLAIIELGEGVEEYVISLPGSNLYGTSITIFLGDGEPWVKYNVDNLLKDDKFTIKFKAGIITHGLDTLVVQDIEGYRGTYAEKTQWLVNGKAIADIDLCYPRYYLQWIDRFGGVQSQPFSKVSTFSESFTPNKTTDYRGRQKLANITVKPRIKITSDWIKEDYFPYYESIFVSPTLLLYDTEEDFAYNVLINKYDYTEKTYDNNSHKLFNLELDLAFDKDETIKY